MGPATIDDLLDVVQWSMACLWAGTWPETDHIGTKLTSGYRAHNASKPLDPSRRHRRAFAQMRGDLKFLWDLFPLDNI